jgi:hypothetical protein
LRSPRFQQLRLLTASHAIFSATQQVLLFPILGQVTPL